MINKIVKVERIIKSPLKWDYYANRNNSNFSSTKKKHWNKSKVGTTSTPNLNSKTNSRTSKKTIMLAPPNHDKSNSYSVTSKCKKLWI